MPHFEFYKRIMNYTYVILYTEHCRVNLDDIYSLCDIFTKFTIVREHQSIETECIITLSNILEIVDEINFLI